MTQRDESDIGLGEWYGPDGSPIDILEWARLFERRGEDMSAESWWRKQTEISDRQRVSTVWIGLNHRFGGGGPPLIWETIVFNNEEGEQQWRYTTRAEAFDDHERIVAALRAGEDPE